MTNEQEMALGELRMALEHATECGLLDVLMGECANPDSINDVCDTVMDTPIGAAS